MRKLIPVFAVFIVYTLALPALAEVPHDDSWTPPVEGAIQMFRHTDRAFAVGADTGGAGVEVEGSDELLPRPICVPFANSHCAIDSTGCSGVCVAYVNYYCDTCTCGSFRFC